MPSIISRSTSSISNKVLVHQFKWIGAGQVVEHYAPQQHLMAMTTNISEDVYNYVGQQDDKDQLLWSGDPDLDQLLMPLWAYRTAAVYLLFISVLGLIMNIVVIIVIVNDPQKTPLNWMLLNLACSDGTIAGFGTPVSTAAALQTGWHFSHELCVAYAMIMSTAGIGSITTLSALALWRCTLVVYCPAKRSTAFSSNSNGQLDGRQATLLLALIWAYALAVTCPPLLGWGRYDREAAHISCSVNWESKMDNNRSYILYMFAMGLIVPLIIIIISYASILRVVKKTSEIKRKTLTTLQSSLAGQHLMPNNLNNNNNNHQHNDAAEKRVTVMVACMIAAFMTAWTPYSILALIETFGSGLSQFSNATTNGSINENIGFVSSISPALATIPSLFAKTSAVLNPLIYGLLNTQFRSACERFSSRFMGRPRRHHHHHHHHRHRHHQNNNSQELIETGGRQLRRLFECHRNLQPSPTVHLPMKEILPVSSSVYAMVTQQVTEVALPSPGSLIQKRPEQKDEQPAVDHVSSSSSSNSSSLSLLIGRGAVASETNQTVQQQQPVSLVIVRLLSRDSTSCCTDELIVNEDCSVLETSVDVSLQGRPKSGPPSFREPGTKRMSWTLGRSLTTTTRDDVPSYYNTMKSSTSAGFNQ